MMIAGMALFLCLPLITHSSYMDYMSTILSLDGSDVSTSSRSEGLTNGFEMLVKRPLLGVGPGCYPLARKAWFGWGLWAHNHYGELMGDLGIIGTVVWFVVFKNYFMRAWRFLKENRGDSPLRNVCLAVVVATIVRLVIGMGSHSVYSFFWYMMAGIIVSAFRIREQDQAGEDRAVFSK